MNQIIKTTIELLLKWKGNLLKKSITKKQIAAIQSDLKVLIMKQNIEIGESGYEFVCEFDGMFYSGIVKDINELGIRMCDLNYGKV